MPLRSPQDLAWPPMQGPKGKLFEGKLPSRHGSACGRSDERGAYGAWSESSGSSGQGTSSICGLLRAGATGGPVVGSRRCSRIALTALRSMTNARTTRRPPQRLHSSTSSRQTRRSSKAQGSREGGRARLRPAQPGRQYGPFGQRASTACFCFRRAGHDCSAPGQS